jgi:tRNA-splicing ligase RtcB
MEGDVIVHRKGAVRARAGEIGIIHGIRSQNHLDEAASAYKNIDEVMANQQDLVRILTRLSPIAVVKG